MRSSKYIALIVVLAFLVCCSDRALSEAKPSTLYFQVKMKSAAGDLIDRHEMYIKGANYVWLTYTAGMKIKLIKNDDGVFLLQPMGRFIATYERGSERESPHYFFPGPMGDVKEFLSEVDAKKVAEEKLGKKLCDVYLYSAKITGRECKLWVDKKSGVPVKLVRIGKKPELNVTGEYVTYKQNVQVPDSLFKLPKGVRIVKMPARRSSVAKEKNGSDPGADGDKKNTSD